MVSLHFLAGGGFGEGWGREVSSIQYPVLSTSTQHAAQLSFASYCLLWDLLGVSSEISRSIRIVDDHDY